MTELGPEGRALLDAARNADAEDMNASRERVRSALGRKIGVAAVGLGTVTAASTATASATAGLFTKVVIGLAALGVVAGGVAVVRSEKAPEPAKIAVVPKPIAVTPLPLPEPTQPVATAAPVVATEPVPSASAPVIKPVAPSTVPSLSAELAALQSANEKLAAGKPGETLAILDAMPKAGTLGEERAGLRLLARCALGQPGAKDAARAFLASHPSSPLAARLQSSCGLE